MLGNVGPAEIIIIIAVLVGVFGKKKTTEIARDMGGASKELKKFRKEYQEALEELQKPIDETAPDDKTQEEKLAQLAKEAKEAKEVKKEAKKGNQKKRPASAKATAGGPPKASLASGGQAGELTARQLDEQMIKNAYPKAEPVQTMKKKSKVRGGEKSA